MTMDSTVSSIIASGWDVGKVHFERTSLWRIVILGLLAAITLQSVVYVRLTRTNHSVY